MAAPLGAAEGSQGPAPKRSEARKPLGSRTEIRRALKGREQPAVTQGRTTEAAQSSVVEHTTELLGEKITQRGVQ